MEAAAGQQITSTTDQCGAQQDSNDDARLQDNLVPDEKLVFTTNPTNAEQHDDNDVECCCDDDGLAEERFRIDRKKLEHMLMAGLQDGSTCAEEFFAKVAEATDTSISWPSKLKIGAKSKKDPHIKVIGQPENIKKAKQMVMSVLDTKTSRVTLKMDVSFTDHSHIIGKGGVSIKRVMQESSCHIHFPDSNRTSSEKSNQVSIAGPPIGVEMARRQIRELLPIELMFEVPTGTLLVPDATTPAIHDIAQVYNVSISFKQRPRSYGFIGSVRGLHSDPLAVKNSILKVLECLTGTVPVAIPVTTQIEIDPKHHACIIGRGACNIKHIMQTTGASINFPDPCSNQGRRGTIAITGTIDSAITAKVMLMECLPLVLMFDIKDNEASASVDCEFVNQLMEKLDLLISVKIKPKQESKAIIIKTIERNASNMYVARQQIVGEDQFLNQCKVLPLPTPQVFNGLSPPPSSINCRTQPSYNNPPLQGLSTMPGNGLSFGFGNEKQRGSSPLQYRNSPVLGLDRSSANGDPGSGFEPISTQANNNSNNSNNNTNGLPGNSGTHCSESTADSLFGDGHTSWRMSAGQMYNEKQSILSSGSNRILVSETGSSDLNLNGSLSLTSSMMDRLVLQQKASAADYETKKQLASKAMCSRVSFGEIRTPTDTWSGLGFSRSMPEKALKDVWTDPSHNISVGTNITRPKPSELHRPSASLDSSTSSVSSTESASSDSISEQRRPAPPPGLEVQKNCVDNAANLLTNNNDYVSLFSNGSGDSSAGALATVADLADLFNKLGLSKYTDAFQEQEVDLLTFMSLTEDDLRELGVAKFGARRRMVMAIQDLQKIHNIPSLVSTPGTQSPLADTLGLLPARHISLDIANQSLRW